MQVDRRRGDAAVSQQPLYHMDVNPLLVFEQGAAAVQAVALFLLVLVFTLIQFRFLERRVFYR